MVVQMCSVMERFLGAHEGLGLELELMFNNFHLLQTLVPDMNIVSYVWCIKLSFMKVIIPGFYFIACR